MLKNGIDIFTYYESIWNASSIIMKLEKKMGYLIKYYVISELTKKKDLLTELNKQILLSYIKNVKEIKNSSKEELGIKAEDYLNFVSNIYIKVFKEDLSGNINLQTSQKFNLCANMLEVLKIFNLFDFQILRLQQYCRYRSKLIEQLLLQGKKPSVGSLKSFKYSPDNDLQFFTPIKPSSEKNLERRNSENFNFNNPLNNSNLSNPPNSQRYSDTYQNNYQKNNNIQEKYVPNKQNNIQKNNTNPFNNNNSHDNIPNDPYNIPNDPYKEAKVTQKPNTRISAIYPIPNIESNSFMDDISMLEELKEWDLDSYDIDKEVRYSLPQNNNKKMLDINDDSKIRKTMNSNVNPKIPTINPFNSGKRYINNSKITGNFPSDENFLAQKKNEILSFNKKAIEDISFDNIENAIQTLKNSITTLQKFPKKINK